VAALLIFLWRRSQSTPAEPDRAATARSSSSADDNASSSAPVISIPVPTVTATVASSFKFGWGTRDGELGHNRRQEGNAEGPMSIATDGDTTIVLDQVNGRLVKIGPDGKPRGNMNVPVTAADDIAVSGDGKIAVLDKLADKTVAIMGQDGKVVGRLPLQGKGVEETGGVTGVFVDGKNVYAEYEHGTLVLLGDTSGKANEDRTQIPGRPSRDGKYLWSVGITDGPSGRLWLSSMDRQTMASRFTRELKMGMTVHAIRMLDTDKQGTVYLATEIEAGQVALLLTCISPADGHPLGSVQLPANTEPEESLRDLAVLDEGGVVYQHRTQDGVTIGKYDCR
jgi:hypothetical protein